MKPVTVTLGVAALAAVAMLSGCGDAAVCGNSDVETGEQCDDGNDRDDDACSNVCLVQDTTDVVLAWRILPEVVPGFVESCDGLGAAKVQLDLAGPISGSWELDCSYTQYIVPALRAGDYTAQVTLFDADGHKLTKGNARTEFAVADTDLSVPVDIGFEDLMTTAYRGDWFFRVKWAGATTCASATPPVVSTRIRLERNGSPLRTEADVAIDGSELRDCYDFEEQFAEAINRLPFGPATLVIEGIDENGLTVHTGTFETFVGAGIVNPPLVYDVPLPE